MKLYIETNSKIETILSDNVSSNKDKVQQLYNIVQELKNISMYYLSTDEKKTLINNCNDYAWNLLRGNSYV